MEKIICIQCRVCKRIKQHYAKGFCRQCYNREWKRSKKYNKNMDDCPTFNNIFISGIVKCNNQEIENHIKYLQNSNCPIIGLIDNIKKKKVILKKGDICYLKSLGSLKTEFGELCGIKSKEIFNRNKFFVKEVISILKKTPNHDEKINFLNSINYFMNKNKNELKITIFYDDDFIIKDGNHSAIALYEKLKKVNKKKINIPIYLIGKFNNFYY